MNFNWSLLNVSIFVTGSGKIYATRAFVCFRTGAATEYFSIKFAAKGALVVLDFLKAEFTDKVQAPAMRMRASVDEVVFELKKAEFTF